MTNLKHSKERKTTTELLIAFLTAVPIWKDRCRMRRGQEDSQLTTQGLLTNRDPN